MKSSFFIVADRGNLKAFRAEKVSPDRPPRLQLVRELNLAEGYAKYRDINEDADGAFPVGSGIEGGRHQNSVAEKKLDIELDRRAARHLADEIHDLLKAEHPGAWSFAAPAELKNAVLERLGAEEKKKLAESVGRDLVKVNTSELLGHFSEVRAA